MKTAPRTRIKICGITRIEDAEAVAHAGADALGLNFAQASSRRVTPAAAARIAETVAGRLTRVGIFLDAEPERVRRVLAQVNLDMLQFHGAETASYCESFGLPYVKTLRVRGRVDGAVLARTHPRACGHLLDAFVAGRPGGTGQTFDWSFWPEPDGLRYALAGGLTPENVAGAVSRTRPWAVDVAGGVEAGTPGEKDPERIARFVAAVRAADGERISGAEH